MHAGALTALVAALAVAPGAAAGAPLISQGTVRMGADALWSTGQLGEGETIAILDEGFAGLDRSIALGELPPRESLTQVDFDAAHGPAGLSLLGEEIQHGTRMAELIHDVAPRARLVLVSYGTMGEFLQAVDWVVANGIPVVSHSNSFLVPPFDGTGPAARAVDAAAARGVLWVNSAGNYAERHWVGRAPGSGTVIPLPRATPQPMSFSLSWQGGGVAADMALERQEPSGEWSLVAESRDRGGWAELEAAPIDAPLRLRVRQSAGPEAELELFSQSVRFGDAAVPEGSIPTPGDAAGALAVGAVRWTGGERVSYSSVGPTADGRVKPDLVAPTYVNSNPEWPGTAGTSAAAAHAAGAAALLRARWRSFGLEPTPAALRARLVATALDVGSPGADMEHGAGLLRIDTSAPRARARVRRGPRPTVDAWARDAGTIRRIEVSLDGVRLRGRAAARIRVRLPRLSGGRHRLVVEATDMAGNTGRIAKWVRT